LISKILENESSGISISFVLKVRRNVMMRQLLENDIVIFLLCKKQI